MLRCAILNVSDEIRGQTPNAPDDGIRGSDPEFHPRRWGVASLTRDNSASEPAPGSFGPFRVLHQIGVGVLGPVFRTYEPSHDRLVAVKAFRLDITPEQARDLADELTRLAELQLFHPSIVAPIAAGVEGTVAYLAQEYVAAESLGIALRHYAPASLAKVLPFITQLAGAVDFAHASGVSHGTLHPRDVFVTPDEARATGFGVAAALAKVGVRAPVRRPYSAPERIAGDEWSAAADVFSLAAIACELLTGRRIAGTGEQAVSGIAAGVQLPEAVQEVLARALDEDPEGRPQRGLEFAAALERASLEADERRGASRTVPASEPSLFDVAEPTATADAAVHEDAPSVRVEPAGAGAPSLEIDDEEPPPNRLDEVVYQQRDEPEPGAEEMEPDRVPEEEEHPAVHLFDADTFDRGETPDFHMMPHDTHDAVAEDRPLLIDDARNRPGMLPYAAVLIVGVFAGFVAGYALGSREQAASKSTSVISPASTAAKAPAAGTEWSETAVAEAPPPSARPTATDVALPPPEAPARRSASSPSTGRLVIRTQPAGARVSINGKRRGVTPLEIGSMPLGAYTIQVARAGYQSASRRVAISAANPEGRAIFGLRRAAAEPAPAGAKSESVFTGTLSVDSRPRGARVLLNGRFIGTTPLVLSGVRAGSHTVRLERDGFTRWASTVRVVSGQRARVAASLERDRTQ